MTRSQGYTFLAWVVALIATMGSLFFSEVMRFPPCVLCWYQRIAMYPLVILFLVAAFHPPRIAIVFTGPLVLIGWLTAIYHNLLHYKVIPETASPCLEGVSCSTVYINWMGFLTIPMLSFFAFTGLLIILLFLNKEAKK